MGLTPKQEKFANLYVELGNASEAYRQAYDVGVDTKDETIWAKSSAIKKKLLPYIDALRKGNTIEFKPKNKPTKGYIYLLHLQGFDFYKIGISQNVPSRKKSIQTLVPFDINTVKAIRIEGYRDIEKQIHEELKEYRYKGEWFKGCLGTMLKTFNKYDR